MQLRSASSKPDVLKGQTLIGFAVRNILYALLMALFTAFRKVVRCARNLSSQIKRVQIISDPSVHSSKPVH